MDKLRMGKFWLWSSIWPWRSRSIVPQNNRDLNQGLLHLWSKFGDPSLNGWWVIARTSWWLMHTHGHTHRQTQATTIPESQNWPRVKKSTLTSLTKLFPLSFIFSNSSSGEGPFDGGGAVCWLEEPIGEEVCWLEALGGNGRLMKLISGIGGSLSRHRGPCWLCKIFWHLVRPWWTTSFVPPICNACL